MSLERVTLQRGIVALRAVPAGASEGTGEPRCFPLPPLELKEMQRRAFDRGRAVERESVALHLEELLARLATSVQALDDMRKAEREQLARFGVEVAVAVAEQLVGTAIRAGNHDIRSIVEALLEEALPILGQGPLELAVNPEDLKALDHLSEGKDSRAVAGRIHVSADPDLPRASCRIRAAGAEILADPKTRLAAVAERLRATAETEPPDA